MSVLHPSFLREPITVPSQELISGYRAMVARYREMAEAEERPFVRDGFLQLAQQFETAMTRLETVST